MQRYELAQKLIREAGERLREARLEPGAVQQKTGHQDLVTRWTPPPSNSSAERS